MNEIISPLIEFDSQNRNSCLSNSSGSISCCCCCHVVLQCPGGAVRAVCVDLVDWQKTQSAVQSLGHIDLLVNNAGVGIIEPFLDVTPDSFDRHVARSLTFCK